MPSLRGLGAIVLCAIMLTAGEVSLPTRAQPLNKLPPAASPCDLLGGEPCHPSFCDVFNNGPCFPQFLPPIGQDLHLTIVTTDDNDPSNQPAAAPPGKPPDTKDKNAEDKTADDKPVQDKATEDKPLDTIGAMYAALRACWVPPPKDEARHGMQYTIRFAFKRDGAIVAPPRVTYSSHDAPADVRDVYRDAVNAALTRCLPLHFSDGMGGAVAGRPIAIRYVDNRTTEKSVQ
jgi:hypothetical protein